MLDEWEIHTSQLRTCKQRFTIKTEEGNRNGCPLQTFVNLKGYSTYIQATLKLHN